MDFLTLHSLQIPGRSLDRVRQAPRSRHGLRAAGTLRCCAVFVWCGAASWMLCCWAGCGAICRVWCCVAWWAECLLNGLALGDKSYHDQTWEITAMLRGNSTYRIAHNATLHSAINVCRASISSLSALERDASRVLHPVRHRYSVSASELFCPLVTLSRDYDTYSW